MEIENIFKLNFNCDNWHLLFDINLPIAILIVIILAISFWIIKRIKTKGKNALIHETIIPVELSFTVGGASTKYQIVRNYSNIEIAHKIYIELITRKAALAIEDENDVILEIYDSWYNLFQVTRNELKNFSGDLLHDNEKSDDLIKLVTDILNLGLRPHLTKYQARFRKWYIERLAEEDDKKVTDRKTPQEIQREYKDYNELIDSIREINQILIKYAEELRKFINSKS